MRPPLALLEILNPKTGDYVWQVIASANGARGWLAKHIVYIREPTEQERLAVEACLNGTPRALHVCKLSELVP